MSWKHRFFYIKYQITTFPYIAKEEFLQWMWGKVPSSWLYWAVIQAWARATSRHFIYKQPGEVTWDMVCNFLDGKYDKKHGHRKKVGEK